MIPKKYTPKQQPACSIRVAEFTRTASGDGTEADTEDPLIQRGVELFSYLVDQANQGESLGVGYAQFVCRLHEVGSFQEVFDHKFAQADVAYVLRLAHRVTAAALRKRVTKNGVTLEAGMDTFIWQSKSPHSRSSKAFQSTPYTEKEWKTVFPDGTRHLLECQKCTLLNHV